MATKSKNVLEIKTVQIAPFRTLMTALKDILLETNITFKQDGIRIVNMDKSHTTLVHLSLDADKFEHYYCKYPKIVVGVNMMHLFKLINTIDNDDTLTLYIAEENFSKPDEPLQLQQPFQLQIPKLAPTINDFFNDPFFH